MTDFRLGSTARAAVTTTRRCVLCFAFITLQTGYAECAEMPDNPQTDPASESPGTSPTPSPINKTLGGRQFWGDMQWLHGWRIQKNVLTGHYRLLDPDDYRHASGTLKDCRDRLQEIRRERKLPEMAGRAVILIHGIVRSSKSFGPLRKQLADAGLMVIGFDYPSTRDEISDSAEFLHEVIESLDGVTEINFVVHSMGGLVTRAYLKDHRDPRIGRMVMLGVPNHGAQMADLLRSNALYRIIYGPAGQQLVTDPDGFIKTLPRPDFEFGIIAGAKGNTTGLNPLIPGDDDGTVSVASTRLEGAADFITVDAMHSFLMSDANVIDYTCRFLQSGGFREDGSRTPIPITVPQTQSNTQPSATDSAAPNPTTSASPGTRPNDSR